MENRMGGELQRALSMLQTAREICDREAARVRNELDRTRSTDGTSNISIMNPSNPISPRPGTSNTPFVQSNSQSQTRRAGRCNNKEHVTESNYCYCDFRFS